MEKGISKEYFLCGKYSTERGTWQIWLLLEADAKDRRINIPKSLFSEVFCREQVQFCDKDMDY